MITFKILQTYPIHCNTCKIVNQYPDRSIELFLAKAVTIEQFLAQVFFL